MFHRDVHGDFQRTLEIVASFLESCGCGPLTTGWKLSEELPKADTWQFVEAHSRWRSVRVVVHPFTADSRTKALRTPERYGLGGREFASALRSFRTSAFGDWAATLFATLQFKLSPSCPTATDAMKHISDGDTFCKASMDPLLKDGLRMRYEASMQLLKSITCSSWACRNSTELRRRTRGVCGHHTFRSGRC